jgi:hypothetical protein
MAWPSSLQIALKEWATVIHALENGQQMILLRKGGVSETAGQFELEHRQFLLFPTFVHQNLPMLKPAFHERFEPFDTEPHAVRLSAAGVITDIIELKHRGQMEAIDDQHVWTAPLLDMRFNYKPEKPLYLMLVRAYRLVDPASITNTPAYAGCKSWVPLDQEVATGGALPVLDDVKYDHVRQTILERIKALAAH